jgi:predicted dienelactone hydrolase
MRPGIFAATLCFALLAAVGATAAPFSAGERHLSTETASAAARNHGDGTIRITLWYPATAPEQEVVIGPTDAPLFLPGKVAVNAPFADQTRQPLILLSHGFGGTAEQLTWLAAPLARAGYIVVSVDHPGSNGRDKLTPEGVYAPWERARDLQAALDRVLADPTLAAHVDRRRIGVGGFSLGGFTSLLEVGARPDLDHFVVFCDGPHRDAICDPQIEYPDDFHEMPKVLAEPGMAALAADRFTDLSDQRVRAAFLIAPAVIEGIDFASLRRLHRPVAIALGAADTVAPPETNGMLAAKLVPGATINVFPGVGHYDFLSECGSGSAALPEAYCAERPGISRRAVHDRVARAAIAFFDRTVRKSGRTIAREVQ